MFIYFEREKEHELGRGRGSGRHRIGSKLQALSCQHRAWHGARTHKLWGHDLSRSQTFNWLSHPGALILFWIKQNSTCIELLHKLTWLVSLVEWGSPGLPAVRCDRWRCWASSAGFWDSPHLFSCNGNSTWIRILRGDSPGGSVG